ncbi:LysR substrate-binding domain-containing protein, partial [Pseudomonas sp. BAgro211]|nr:LysR substrate-binding domain-containing protein [Pseudomonas sp. BAgro211]
MLFEESLTPVCSRQWLEKAPPLKNPTDLSEHGLLHPARDKHDWEEWFASAGFPNTPMPGGHHFETLDLALSVALQGSGVALGDWMLTQDDLINGQLVAPFQHRHFTGGAYFLAYP